MTFCNAVLALKLSVGKSDVQCMLPLIKVYITAVLNSLYEDALHLEDFTL